MKSRIKEYNPGAVLKLLDDDLLIAQVFPLSKGVHVIKIILSNDGAIECGEYVISPGEEIRFNHKTMLIDRTLLAGIKKKLEMLGKIDEEIGFDNIDCDWSGYEEPERRSLNYWVLGNERFSSQPTSEFFIDHSIDENTVNEHINLYNSIWDSILGILGRHAI